MTEPTPERQSVTALDADAGLRLDRFLAGRIEGLSRSRVQALIRDGAVALAAKTIGDPGYRVKRGDAFVLQLPEPEAAEPAPENIALDVVYEDEVLIVIDKPAGLVVHPAAGHATGTLVNALLAHCGGSLSGIGGVRRPGIVHRLDKDTSGLLVVAKTDRAHQGLAAQFAAHGRDGRMSRRYLALVWGTFERKTGTVDVPLARSIANRKKIAVVRELSTARSAYDREPFTPDQPRRRRAERPDQAAEPAEPPAVASDAARVRSGAGREAVTHFEVTEVFPGADGKPVATLLRLELETGRTHQIRVHMAHIAHPVMGDAVYGAGFKASASRLLPAAADALTALGRQALHATSLAFEHPLTRRKLAFERPPPKDMQRLLEALRAK